MRRISSPLLLLLLITILAIHFNYYPKWNKLKTEATISWDVSGYYFYLPAIFIYNDLKQLSFADDILKKYQPTGDFQQAYKHEKTGNYVCKYSMGQAVQFLPFFGVGHLWASFSTRYPADGFSRPYQVAISLGSLIICMIGLYLLHQVLMLYFSGVTVALTISAIVLASNYLNYSAIDGAMTHNNLFTIYCAIVYFTIRNLANPDYKKSIFLGALVGLAALTRPTEIISVLIPILWGVNFLDKESVKKRLAFFILHRRKVVAAFGACIAVGSLQLFYWKYVTGNWIEYSYQKHGFSWLSPHLIEGIFSYRSGWLTYSPVMLFSLIGFIFFFRSYRQYFWSVFLFCVLFIYITFSWDVWWYGSSLGQRAMVQAYPLLAFPLAGFHEHLIRQKKFMLMYIPVLLFFIFVNLWFTHQAHHGKLLVPGQMTKAYYWKTFLTFRADREHLKLLDHTSDLYEGKRYAIRSLGTWLDTTLVLPKGDHSSPEFKCRISSNADYDWIRVAATVTLDEKEWSIWSMTQLLVFLRNGDHLVDRKMIRIQRLMDRKQTKTIFLDIPKPTGAIDNIVIKLWNHGGKFDIKISDVTLEIYNSKPS